MVHTREKDQGNDNNQGSSVVNPIFLSSKNAWTNHSLPNFNFI